MERTLTLTALALTGIFVACGAHATQIDIDSAIYQEAAVAAPVMALGTLDDQHDVIAPPSSIDPGMALDPPQTGAKMPVIRPPGTRDGKMVLPR
jgi:hypothetical protein